MSKNKHQGSMLSTFILPISLVCLFAFSAFVLTFLGSASYKNIKKNFDAVNNETVIVSYLSTKLRQANVQGALAIERTEEGDCLVIEEINDMGKTYETTIFCKDGGLYEDYHEKESAFDGGNTAMKITALDTLVLTPITENLLEIETRLENGSSQRFNIWLTGIKEKTEEGR